MDIPEKQKQILAKPDEELFMSGACHVFADELCREFVAHDYQLCALQAERWQTHPCIEDSLVDKKGLMHVLAWKDDLVIDINGVKQRAELLVEWESKTSDLPGDWVIYYKEIDIRACCRGELFEKRLIEPDAGPMSSHRLYLDLQFLHESRSRAHRIITSARRKFDIDFS